MLSLRGELSTLTAPALDSLLAALRDSGERRIVIDLRDAVVMAPAVDLVVRRWDAVAGSAPGTYDVVLTVD